MTEVTSDREMVLRREIASVLNKYSLENGSNTPDFILANYLRDCLGAFDAAVRSREDWHSQNHISRFAGDGHASDCATHNAPALPAGECDCN